MLRRAVASGSSQLSFVQQRSLFKGIKYQKTRLPPKIKRRQSPNEHGNTVGVFHSGMRLPVNITKHFDRFVDVANNSEYHPPFLVHDYIMDTSDYLLEPFNAGKGVVMNRGHVMNALDFNGIDQFSGLAKKYMHEPAAGTVTFLKARGSTWSTGTNFIEIHQNLDTPEGREKIFSYYRKLYQTIHHLHNGPSILCPFVDGLAMGSAASFAVNCRVTATGPQADLCWPETSFGFHPDAGACHILNTLPYGIGEWMALTGSRLIGNSIVKAGLGSWSYTEDLVQAMQIYMDEYPNTGPKTGVRILENMSGLTEDPFELLPYLEVMERCFVKETMPEIMAALEKESATSDWAKRQLEKLKTKSPLSLVITLEALNRSRGKSINYVLRQDFRLTTRFLDSKDFREGVQKLIIDGGFEGKPVWEHKSVSDVPQETVEAFFAPTGNEDTEFIVEGHDDKEQLENQYEAMMEEYHWIMYGQKLRSRNHKLAPVKSERDLASTSFLSNKHPSVPIQEIFDDKGHTPMRTWYYNTEYFERNLLKRHYDGPTLFKKYDCAEISYRLRLLDSVYADQVYAEERPVSEHGLWRGRYDIFDSYNELRKEFNVVQHPYPRYDSIIRNRTVSAEEKQVEEEEYESEVEVFADKDDYKPLPRKTMRFPPGEKLPESLADADRHDFSDDDYSSVEEEESSGAVHTRIRKDRQIVDPQLSRWDSDF